MRAGKLRHRITIQQLVAGSPDTLPTGEPDVSWAEYLTVYASIDPVTGREPFLSQQKIGETSHKVRIRYRSGIVPKMRVLYGSRVFDILAVLNWEEKNAELLLLCSEGLNEG